jgi:type IV secretory pathway VirB4 component
MTALTRWRRHRGADGSTPGDGATGVPGPDAVQVEARQLAVAGGYAASFWVSGYPAEVYGGWLEPLLAYPGRLDIAVHIDPLAPVEAQIRLRRQLGRWESTRRHGADRGKLADPHVEAAAADAAELASAVARGETKLFRVGLYLTVHARTRDELAEQVERVRALAASMLLEARPATFRSLQGWISTLPLGVDCLDGRRVMDTAALAATFPFADSDVPIPDPSPHAAPTGVFYGLSGTGSGLVLWDRWAQDNYNSVILARSGAGKSYLTKLEALRSLYTGVEVAIVDPEDEYRALADAVGGAYLHLGAPGVRINPFDLPAHAGPDQPDTLARQVMFAHTFTGALLGSLTAEETAALDSAVLAAYHAKGITDDPDTWRRPAPLLADLAHTLTTAGNTVSSQLAAKLAPYVSGSHRGLFDGPSTTRPDGHLVVISLRELPDELKTVGTLLALDTLWRQVTNPTSRRPRLIVIDEAWLLMRQEQGARFVHRMAKSARKYWAGLCVVTQDAADLLAADLGKAVVANAATQLLMRPGAHAIDTITTAFRLSDGERAYLLAAQPGDALLVAGTQRVGFHVVASPAEHELATTNPAELATRETDAHASSPPATDAPVIHDDPDIEP